MKIAYVHAVSFPNHWANSLDAVWTAAALSDTVDTTFFMPRLSVSRSALKMDYGIEGSPLRLQSMHLDLVPYRLLGLFRDYYGQLLSGYLRHHPRWARSRGRKVLYLRHPRALLYWGLQREHQRWLRDWVLCYESHDPLGLDPNEFRGTNPFDLRDGAEGERRQAILRAARNFDVIICNTRALSDDLAAWTHGEIRPHFITLASRLPRLPEPPSIPRFGERILLGYIGTIDKYRGVDVLLEAMRFLPQNYTLRIVGWRRQEEGVDGSWLDNLLADRSIGSRVEIAGPVPASEVMKEIDRCDIVLQPASGDVNDSRYSSPQKSFDYMVRGKVVVAGDVPCHRELFQDGKTAALYQLDPRSLAECVVRLVSHPALAEQVARGAWEQSATYNLSRRVREIIALSEASSRVG
jgi:glycosyltransferase involved in cell wall biosynthesis